MASIISFGRLTRFDLIRKRNIDTTIEGRCSAQFAKSCAFESCVGERRYLEPSPPTDTPFYNFFGCLGDFCKTQKWKAGSVQHNIYGGVQFGLDMVPRIPLKKPEARCTLTMSYGE
eukprot:946879-Amphidinium_carterae.1